MQWIMLEQTQINTALREREDERDERRAQRRSEMEARINGILRHNVIHERIARAYPHLSEGEHNGSHFRQIIERADKRRKEKKEDRKNG